ATVMQKVSTCFGISEQSAAKLGLSIFPNPNNGTFTIKAAVDLELILVNELGQVIKNISLSSLNDHTQQIVEVSNGIYFITGNQSGITINEKIVITK
ncbi:MAG: T9SS type A sorting domain-containing protein, partial [bacterium]|nr:T9SS type A sorting domain-containing protein [bacterium]